MWLSLQIMKLMKGSKLIYVVNFEFILWVEFIHVLGLIWDLIFNLY